MRQLPGEPFPLGAVWDGHGTNFAVYSESAEQIDLCLFDDEDRETRVRLTERSGDNWHCYLPDVGPGQRYGLRAHGAWAPERGLRFNPARLLIDPYAKAIEGDVRWDVANVLSYDPDAEGDPGQEMDASDDADAVPRCVVIDPAFDWEDDRPPRVLWEDTVVYEAHVRGLTITHPDVREDLRGTYAAIASEPIVAHLQHLGVTAIELLPVQHFVHDQHLVERGLANYWGYNTIGFLAPYARYAATGARGEQVSEFKGMVKALHRAGIEVILDVVYNHTPEGNHRGPTLSLRGLDNPAYYRLEPEDPRYYTDFTGTGNTLNVPHPNALRLVTDSLRYWVTEMHVDGFRFDLAVTLARQEVDFSPDATFLATLHQDPVLSQVKLIAEPWDVGPHGYRLGGFPALWSEWNAHYRDVVRDFWRREPRGVADLASSLSGSAEIFRGAGRRPRASINLITAHDGYTLADLVSYEEKHNEANGESNADGHSDNRSWNSGVEGPTKDPAILALRRRQQRNLLTTLMLSQGVPMLLAGDELGRTQRGNNNAYCQDNEISWIDWELEPEQAALLEFTQRLLELRRTHPVLRRRDFFVGSDVEGSNLRDIWWFRLDGREMSRRDWVNPEVRTLGAFLNGEELRVESPEGGPVFDDSFILLLNAGEGEMIFRLPAKRFGNRWREVLATARPDDPEGANLYDARAFVSVEESSLVLLRRAW